MAQEDQTQRCSNSNTSSGGGGGGGGSSRSSKKQRAKKVPQRGLGVAQLEKIRIEEQQKKDAAIAVAAANTQSSSSPISSSYLSLPIPNFHHPSNHQSCSSSSSIPFPVSSDVIISPPPNSIFRPPPLSVVDNNNNNNNNNIVSTSSNSTVPLTSCSPGWNPGNGSAAANINNGHKYWSSCEYNIEKECSRLDPGFVFRTNLSLPYESEPTWPLPTLMQRPAPQPFQQPSSSMVYLSSRSSSTSVMNFQMEPPSNQSYYGNCSFLLPEEEKMVGMKRSYPFSLDNAPGPPFHTKYPPNIVHSINGQIEAASSSNGSTFNFDPGSTPNFREGPSGSTSNLESKSKKSIKQNGVDGDFLTLAPPTTTSMCSTSKFKHPPSNLIYYNCELPDVGYSLTDYQASFEDSIIRQSGGGGLNQYRPYYSFFPPAMVQIDRATTITMGNCKSGEVGGHVDLNLKL